MEESFPIKDRDEKVERTDGKCARIILRKGDGDVLSQLREAGRWREGGEAGRWRESSEGGRAKWEGGREIKQNKKEGERGSKMGGRERDGKIEIGKHHKFMK